MRCNEIQNRNIISTILIAPISFDFAKALADFGVDNAVYWNSCTTGSSRYESTERMVISIF